MTYSGSSRVHRRRGCPHCNATNVYEVWNDEPDQEVECPICRKRFAVGLGTYILRPRRSAELSDSAMDKSSDETEPSLKSLGARLTMETADERVKASPEDPLAHAILGELLCEAGKYEEAIKECRESLTLDPSKYPIWKLLHGLYRRTGRPETVRIQAVFEEGRRIERDMVVITDLCISSADHKNALRALTTLLDWDLEDPLALARLGRLHLLNRDYNSAVKILEPLSKSKPFAGKAGLLLGRAYLFAGKRKEAEKMLKLALGNGMAVLTSEFSRLTAGKTDDESPEYIVQSCVDLLKLLADYRSKPTQRLSLLTYEGGEEAMQTYADIQDRGSISLKVNAEMHGRPPTGVHWYYPDIDAPTGTTLEDLLYGLRTGFDSLFPKDGAVFVVGILDMQQGREIVLCNDRTGPHEIAKYEPSALDWFWVRESHPGVRWDQLILTGDVVFLKPFRPETYDHTAVSPVSDRARERMLQISAHGVAAQEAERCIRLREKLITEQAGKRRKR